MNACVAHRMALPYCSIRYSKRLKSPKSRAQAEIMSILDQLKIYKNSRNNSQRAVSYQNSFELVSHINILDKRSIVSAFQGIRK